MNRASQVKQQKIFFAFPTTLWIISPCKICFTALPVKSGFVIRLTIVICPMSMLKKNLLRKYTLFKPTIIQNFPHYFNANGKVLSPFAFWLNLLLLAKIYFFTKIREKLIQYSETM